MKIISTSWLVSFVFSTILFFNCIEIHAQKKIVIDKGSINLISDAPLELIKATSDQVKGVIDPTTNQVAFIIQIRSFRGFNSKLQQEHFNEKYLESEKFPTASFEGKIIDQIDFSVNGVYEVRAKGNLEVHGQKQIRIIKCKIKINNSEINFASEFKVPLTDYNISIPRIISEKIATEIDVNLFASAILKP
jgi:hypothetical protein